MKRRILVLPLESTKVHKPDARVNLFLRVFGGEALLDVLVFAS
jgi:hypothetical protein